MAGDWIKMRTDMYRDPKVCVIADFLLDKEGGLSRYVNQQCQRDMTVTRNVMRNATVGALASVWGVMRMRGKCDGVDLVCRCATLAVIDDIADLPGFGDAMNAVGWVEETADGLVFPRFFEDHNVDPDSTAKQKAAERQRRFRERRNAEKTSGDESHGDVTRDVTVTDREEKRREEEKHSKARSALSASDLIADGLTPETAADWLDFRKKKRAPLTQTAWNGIKAQAERAGWSLEAVVTKCMARGWQGFEAAWVASEQPEQPQQSRFAGLK